MAADGGAEPRVLRPAELMAAFVLLTVPISLSIRLLCDILIPPAASHPSRHLRAQGSASAA